MSTMSPAFNGNRLRDDLKAKGLTAKDLAKIMVARESGDGAYAYQHQSYQKNLARILRLLDGKSSLATVSAIADAIGYAASRYITLSAVGKRYRITA